MLFIQEKIEICGSCVSASGIEPDNEKVLKGKELPTPLNPDEVMKYLGFIGYYRKFIRNFSK